MLERLAARHEVAFCLTRPDRPAGRGRRVTPPPAKLTPADRELDWSRPPEELLNRVRALSPHVGARAELDGRRVTIWRARIEDGRLVPVEVQPEGRRRMSYDEFLRGLRS